MPVSFEIPRGDYLTIEINISDVNGNPYTLLSGEDIIITFAKSYTSEDCVIQKSLLQGEMTLVDGKYICPINTGDTINLTLNTTYQGDITLVQLGDKRRTLDYLTLKILNNLSNKVVEI
jgi:hypothetical protein